jgi:hypothetical protein
MLCLGGGLGALRLRGHAPCLIAPVYASCRATPLAMRSTATAVHALNPGLIPVRNKTTIVVDRRKRGPCTKLHIDRPNMLITPVSP